MIRILAVADLHVTERQREGDQRAVLARITDDAERIRPSLSILGGDLYGHAVPHRSTPTERAILAPFVQRLAKHGPVLIVPGNHDVIEDLEILGRLQGEWPILVATEPEIVRVETRDGLVDVCALPFPRKRGWLDEDDVRGAEASRAALQAKLAELVGLWGELIPMRRKSVEAVIFAGHAQVSGSRTGGGEVLSGSEIEIAPSLLSALPVDAGVLGHIHLCQSPADRCWYTGSPWPQDFGEKEAKSYLLIDVGAPEFGAWDPVLNGGGPPLGEHLAVYPRSAARDSASVSRIWTRAPGLVSLTWRWGVPHGDESARPTWLERPDVAPKDVDGAHVRARLHVQPQARATCPFEREAGPYRAVATTWKEELVIETSTTVRAPEIAAAENLHDKLAAYWRASTPPPAPELQDAALTALDVLEHDGAAPTLARIAAIRSET